MEINCRILYGAKRWKLFGWLAGWLVVWLAGWLVGWGWLGLAGWLVVWLAGVGWGCLVGWLSGWLVESIENKTWNELSKKENEIATSQYP